MGDSNFPRPPLGYTALRRELRNGLSAQARQIWWPSLPRIPDGSGIDAFSNVSELATNRYKCKGCIVSYDISVSPNHFHLYVYRRRGECGSKPRS